MNRIPVLHGTRSLVVLVLVALVLAGCTGPAPGDGDNAADEDAGTLKIGALLALTGSGASYGNPALNGIRLAVEEINAEGGIDGRTVEIVEGDSRFPETQEAVASMERIVGDGVPLVIGATASDSAAAVIPIANENEVILVSPGATRPSLTGTDHGYFFRTIASDAVQGPQAAQFVYEDLGADEVVVMYEQTAYGQGLKDQFVESYPELGGSVNGDPISWQHDESVYEGRAAEAIGRGSNFIWIAGQAPHIGDLIDAIRGLGFTGTIMGTEALENPSVFDAGGDAMDGVLFTKSGPGLGSSRAATFEQSYEDRFGEGPGVFSAFAYDAVYVAKAAIAAVGTDGAAIKAWLESGNPVPDRVTTETIRFNSEGDVTTGGYALWQAVYDDGEGHFEPYRGE